MNTHYLKGLPVALACLAMGTSIAWSEDFQWDHLHSPPSIEGVWRVTRHGVNCATGEEISTFPALMTFHADGAVSGQAVGPGSTNAYGPAEFGVWNRNKHSQGFSFRLLSYNYSDTGVIAGSIEVTGTAELTGGDAFSYKSSVEFYDANGNLLVAHCGKATGLRF
jgi:hypothetical protein